MNLAFVKATDWGLIFNTGQAQAPGEPFKFGSGATRAGLVFIDQDGDGAKPEMNVVLHDIGVDADSTDVNTFRHYNAPIADVLRALQQVGSIANALQGRPLNAIDRELVNVLKFTRIV